MSRGFDRVTRNEHGAQCVTKVAADIIRVAFLTPPVSVSALRFHVPAVDAVT